MVFVVLVVVVAAVAWVLQRRRPDAPAQGPSWAVPSQLDRADFDRPDAPWLVTVFSSATCTSCRMVWEKARHLASDTVAVQEVEAVVQRPLHDRYGVEAVPMVLVSDAAGAVRASFLGEPSATDLWAAVAELREPGSTPESCNHGEPHEA
ncbi:MAG: hypothetical protein JWM05_2769 [Acidimicrobiales bacterium]|nr:hypothetical protein [Acidimicrobiales bacterium]